MNEMVTFGGHFCLLSVSLIMSKGDQPIVFFDGVCNFCNSSVQFIIKHDRNGVFKFASLQSSFADSFLNAETKEDSIILWMDDQFYYKSDAVIRIIKKLDGVWRLGAIMVIFPRRFRNYIYDIIAKNRYRWFGKKEQCMIPSPELKARFLD